MDKILKAFQPPSLEKITEMNRFSFQVFGFEFEVNVTTVVMTWVVMGIILLGGWFFGRKLKDLPGRTQCFVEATLEFFRSITIDTMGEEGKRYFPLIMTLFLFILISNWLSVIPCMKSPTSDLNTTLGLGVMVLLVAHSSALFKKGSFEYIKGFFQPVLIAPFALFINICGEFGKTISHSFRLFGNIFGGSLLLFIVFEMPKYLKPVLPEVVYFISWPFLRLIFPIGLNLFFGLGIGLLQAFVFTVLAIAYIDVARR
jgi:F-type H+-transporting ATPase subunit a